MSKCRTKKRAGWRRASLHRVTTVARALVSPHSRSRAAATPVGNRLVWEPVTIDRGGESATPGHERAAPPALAGAWPRPRGMFRRSHEVCNNKEATHTRGEKTIQTSSRAVSLHNRISTTLPTHTCYLELAPVAISTGLVLVTCREAVRHQRKTCREPLVGVHLGLDVKHIELLNIISVSNDARGGSPGAVAPLKDLVHSLVALVLIDWLLSRRPSSPPHNYRLDSSLPLGMYCAIDIRPRRDPARPIT